VGLGIKYPCNILRSARIRCERIRDVHSSTEMWEGSSKVKNRYFNTSANQKLSISVNLSMTVAIVLSANRVKE
jgi:hypothetical protein